MGFDFFQSRRNYNEQCKWWKRNESDAYDEDEFIFRRVPSGTFYARPVNAETNDDNFIAGIFVVNRASVTIESPDDLSGIGAQDLVEYQGEFWRVDNVQYKRAKIQNSEFGRANTVSYYWYLSLIKG